MLITLSGVITPAEIEDDLLSSVFFFAALFSFIKREYANQFFYVAAEMPFCCFPFCCGINCDFILFYFFFLKSFYLSSFPKVSLYFIFIFCRKEKQIKTSENCSSNLLDPSGGSWNEEHAC